MHLTEVMAERGRMVAGQGPESAAGRNVTTNTSNECRNEDNNQEAQSTTSSPGRLLIEASKRKSRDASESAR